MPNINPEKTERIITALQKLISLDLNNELNFYSIFLLNALTAPEIETEPDFMDLGHWLINNYLVVDLLENFIIAKTDPDLEAELLRELKLLTCAMGGEQKMSVFLVNELQTTLLSALSSVDKNRLAYTFGRLAGMDKIFNYKVILISILTGEKLAVQKLKIWEDHLLSGLLLRAVWSWWPKLDEDEKKWLLKNYFYTALFFDIPVEKILANYLYTSIDAYEYTFKTKMIVESLEENEEEVLVNIGTKQVKKLKEIFSEFLLEVGQIENVSTNTVTDFVDKIYFNQEKTLDYYHFLFVSLDIYAHLKRGKLVENIYRDNGSITWQVEQEMFALLTEFFSGPIFLGWEQIAVYYQTQTPLIPLYTFLSELKTHDETLDNDELVKKVLEFSTFLQQNHILQPGQDLVIFSEVDNKFHWNDDLFVELRKK